MVEVVGVVGDLWILLQFALIDEDVDTVRTNAACGTQPNILMIYQKLNSNKNLYKNVNETLFIDFDP